MDTSRLSKGEWLVGGGGLLIFLISFLKPWAKASLGGFSEEGDAWDAYGFLVKLAIILALAAAVLVGLKLAGVNFDMPMARAQLYMAVGAATTVLLLLGLLVGPDDEGASALGVDVDRGLWLYVAVVLAAAMTYGGFMHSQEESSAPAGGPGPTTPPPPA